MAAVEKKQEEDKKRSPRAIMYVVHWWMREDDDEDNMKIRTGYMKNVYASEVDAMAEATRGNIERLRGSEVLLYLMGIGCAVAPDETYADPRSAEQKTELTWMGVYTRADVLTRYTQSLKLLEGRRNSSCDTEVTLYEVNTVNVIPETRQYN